MKLKEKLAIEWSWRGCWDEGDPAMLSYQAGFKAGFEAALKLAAEHDCVVSPADANEMLLIGEEEVES